MTRLRLSKHHGLGNDFLVAFHPGVDDLADLARRLCDRHRGIGADGLLVGESEEGFAARMVLFNADGTRAEMSGNGIRCFAQALASRRGDLDDQRILTDAGERTVTISATDDADTVDVRVEMGEVGSLDEPDGWARLECHPDRPVTHLSLGNPHSVVGVDDVDVVDLVDLGSRVPQVNLEIIEPGPEHDAVTMRVHERGVGLTEACGTGACASAVAARDWGLVPASASSTTVHMPGGDVTVELAGERPGPPVAILTGPATHVADIEVDLPADSVTAAPGLHG